MAKNRAKSPAELLAEFVSKPRSNVFREICQASSDKNGLQSDAAGARLRDEMKSVLTDLLSGQNVDRVNDLLARHTRRNAKIRIRAAGTKHWGLDFYIAESKPLSLTGGNSWFLDTVYPNPVTAHQLIYGVLKRALESRDIEQLGLCRREACRKIWYRASRKGEFCPGPCRWKHRNYIAALEKRNRSPSKKEKQITSLAITALKQMKKYIRDHRIGRVADLPLDRIDNWFGALRQRLGEHFHAGEITDLLWCDESVESAVTKLPLRFKRALSETVSSNA